MVGATLVSHRGEHSGTGGPCCHSVGRVGVLMNLYIVTIIELEFVVTKWPVTILSGLMRLDIPFCAGIWFRFRIQYPTNSLIIVFVYWR